MPPLAPRISAVVVPALLWLWLFHHLHYEWTLNEQYNYGWAVPFLAAFLFYTRWAGRPQPQPIRAVAPVSMLSWTLLVLLLPLRVIEEANPDWRLLSWTLGVVVVGYTLLTLLRAGGVPWVRYFAFPVCFPLVSIPWLVQFENAVVQSLTRAVAYVAVEISGWLGVGAYQLGNVIQLHNGFVGVDEACSGVKTLQAAIMVSLFFGELLRLTIGRRVLLVVLGSAWVFGCNVGRAATLVMLAATRGLDALKEWHDGIGTAVLIVGMVGLVGIALLLARRGQVPQAEGPGEDAGWELKMPLREAVAALAWLAAVFVSAELWYRWHEQRLIARPAWHARWPAEYTNIREMPIADETRAILRYNHASSASWEEPPGVSWWTFFARWEPQQTALQLVRSHSPEICLPAAGRTFRAQLAPLVLATDAMPLTFRVYEFEQSGRPLFVYVCIQEDKVPATADAAQAAEWNLRGRLRAVASGQRNLGQRLLEIAVSGFQDPKQANDAMERAVRQIVVRGAATG